MTLDTIHSLIVTVTWVPIVIVFTSYIARLNKRLDRQEAEIRQLWNRITPLEIALAQVRSAENQNALDICRIGDMASDTVGEVSAQARTLDNHTDRLSVLERER